MWKPAVRSRGVSRSTKPIRRHFVPSFPAYTRPGSKSSAAGAGRCWKPQPDDSPKGDRTMRFITIFVVPLLLAACIATAQSWTPPAENQRCPSKWGAGDERGSGNLMKPEQVLKAAKLIRTGEVIELGQVLDPGTMPFFPGRQLSILTKRTNVLPQSNRRISNEEMVIGELGQIGTQFDGFSHQGIDNGFYNCFKQDQIATRNGFSKLGIENVGALMTP